MAIGPARKLRLFLGQYDDSDPHICQDGKTLYFISDRPSEAEQPSADIWVVKREDTGSWGEPARLDSLLNSRQREYSPERMLPGICILLLIESAATGRAIYIWPGKNKEHLVNLSIWEVPSIRTRENGIWK